MNMAEVFPNDHEPLKAPEELVAIELLSDLHGYYKGALEKDNLDVDGNVALGPLSDAMKRERYVLKCIAGDSALPTDYNQLVWIPKVEDAGFHAIILKVPVLREEMSFFHLPPGADHWNDMVVEIIHDGGVLQRYLFNSHGIEAYIDYDSLDESFNSDSHDNADLFSVSPEGISKAKNVPPLVPSNLKKMIANADMVRQGSQ